MSVDSLVQLFSQLNYTRVRTQFRTNDFLRSYILFYWKLFFLSFYFEE